MPTDAAPGAGMPGSGGAAGNAQAGVDSGNVDLEKLVNDAVSKALGARMKRLNLEEQVAKAVEASLAKIAESAGSHETENAQAGDAASPSERPTLKALQEKYDAELKSIKAQFQQEQKARQEAELRAKDARMRAEFQSKLAAKLGADHPLLGTLMDSLYDVKKRVAEQGGRYAVRFVDQWGNEEFKPLDEGVSALFDGELKHLVQASKAQQLPPPGVPRGLAGQKFQQQQPGQPRRNPLYEEVARHYAAQGDMEVAAVFQNAVGNGGNGTPK